MLRLVWRRVASTIAVLVLSGCTSLAPVDLPPEYTPPPADTDTWGALVETRDGDWYSLLNEGPVALDWRLRMIDSAIESIDLQTFLWTFDTVGAVVVDHLLDAAERGVEIKILVDDSFILDEDAILLQIASHPNIEYRVYNPYQRRASKVVAREALNLAEFHRLDHRMHNKAMIVDNRVAIVGGRNLADEYFGLHSVFNFRDLEVIIGGPVVLGVSQAFDRYWNDRWSIPIEMLSHVASIPADLKAARQVAKDISHLHLEQTADGRRRSWLTLAENAHDGNSILLVDDPPVENPALEKEAPVQVANALVEMFENADEEIIIISAYLIPTPELEGAVTRAIVRGVRVRMLTNSIRSNNHLTAHSAYRNHIKTLLYNGAGLHEVRIDASDRHMYMLSPVGDKDLALHAKVLIIDHDRVFIGSANLDPRSLRINTEMGLVIESAALNAELRSAVISDFERKNAWELQLDENQNVLWVSDQARLTSQPAVSTMQRIEDWLFSHLPLEKEL